SELRRRRVTFRLGDRVLAPAPAPLRAKVIECDAPCDRAEPCASRSAPVVETAPRTKRALERVGREILGERRVARQHKEVAVDVVEVPLGRLRERRRPRRRQAARGKRRRRSAHVVHTPPRTFWSQGLSCAPPGRIAQRESARFTRGRSLVRSQVRPLEIRWKPAGFLLLRYCGTSHSLVFGNALETLRRPAVLQPFTHE